MEGNLAEAGRQEQVALELFRETDTQDGITSALSGLGEIALAHEDYPTARNYLEESATIARERDLKNFLPWVLVSLSITRLEMGDFMEGQALLRECLDILRVQGTQSNLAAILSSYGRLAFLNGKPRRATRLYGATATLRIINPMSPHEVARYSREEAEVYAALRQTDFTTLYEIGQTMTPERAIAFALSEEV